MSVEGPPCGGAAGGGMSCPRAAKARPAAGEGRVGLERQVRRHRVEVDLGARARRERRALDGGDDSIGELPERLDVGRADVEQGRRPLGHDVRRRTAVGDDPVDAIGGRMC
jgi:hypothetical protein